MSLPAFVDWTWTYLSMLPVRSQGGTGGCWGATICYAMELRALLQGYPPRQLAMRYSMYMDGRYDTGGSVMYAACGDAQRYGMCLESLMPMPDYQAVDMREWDNLTLAAIRTPPSAAASADGQNQLLTDYAPMSYMGLADMTLKAQTAIAAGYPIFVINAAGNHVCVGWGYDYAGVFGLDSRSREAYPYHWDWTQISQIAGMVRDVRFANAKIGTPPQMLPKPGTVPIIQPPPPPPPPPPPGNTQMLIDNIKAAGNALALGQITQAQIDAGKALWAQLVPDAGAVVQPAGASPDGTEVPTAAQQINDGKGGIWTLGGPETANAQGPQTLRNGVWTGGGQATRLRWKGGKVGAYAGVWFVWEEPAGGGRGAWVRQ